MQTIKTPLAPEVTLLESEIEYKENKLPQQEQPSSHHKQPKRKVSARLIPPHTVQM